MRATWLTSVQQWVWGQCKVRVVERIVLIGLMWLLVTLGVL